MTDSSDTRERILDAAQITMARKGWAAVGIKEVLEVAGVPKGSFYHWFDSKDAFGEAMMQRYFANYLAEMDAIFARTDATAADRLMAYWQNWRENQSIEECQGKCLAVKLGAEVADLSEPMRVALKQGTTGIIDRIRSMLEAGKADGSLVADGDASETAHALYDMWLGASVMAKIHRDASPLDSALASTSRILGLI